MLQSRNTANWRLRDFSSQVYSAAAALNGSRSSPTRRNSLIGAPRTSVFKARQGSLKETLPQRSLSPEETEKDADTAVTAIENSLGRIHSLRHAKRLPKPQVLDATR